ncbi:forkhead box protein N1 isoform X2 [Thalassophryne amazonica]|uniref:forkhead box protein N1 isoform X2 n=1 Tax=Thalassophryne amazonica TaxID=390379 RepID=UPI0014716EA6|nr:forkhead box protein N1 isoform X2 [Thalassophryne amazonica]
MAESQDGDIFSVRSTATARRHGADGAVVPGSGSVPAPGPVEADRFHPYHQQFRDGEMTTAGCLQHGSSSLSCLQEVHSPDTCSVSHSPNSETATTWGHYNSTVQESFPELTSVPAERYCFVSRSYSSSSLRSPIQQVSSRHYPTNELCNGSKYSPQSMSTPSHQDSTTQCLFPKPIYSYSILIFMALKNSKTGSLPVSEIYSFMTEHFPYFKTAPDGWKNSVRHNLSLNKCFEKVENKNGNSSRKGCLWALNPAKVEKMQEELYKWRRKDPVTVRRSMAKPEELDHLLGERPGKFRSLPHYTSPAVLSRVASIYGTASSACTQRQRSYHPIRHQQFPRVLPPSQPPCYHFSSSPSPGTSFALYSPCVLQTVQTAAGFPASTESLNSPLAGKMAPVYDVALQTECSTGLRSTQDLLLEGETSCDLDTLNPSLTDLPFQGNVWEELREDSLVSNTQIVATTTPPTTSTLQNLHRHTCCLQALTPLSETVEVTPVSRLMGEDENTGSGQSVEQHGCFSGLHPGMYSGVESCAGYLTSCTSISLI